MPRTPAPLTVERDLTSGVYTAKTDRGDIRGTFKSEADARAFVALPALIDVGRKLLDALTADGYRSYPLVTEFTELLSQAYGQHNEETQK
jgi:hypothetical protein